MSYGGSSLISLAYGLGMLVALTRERPRAKLGNAPVGMTRDMAATSAAPAAAGAV